MSKTTLNYVLSLRHQTVEKMQLQDVAKRNGKEKERKRKWKERENKNI